MHVTITAGVGVLQDEVPTFDLVHWLDSNPSTYTLTACGGCPHPHVHQRINHVSDNHSARWYYLIVNEVKYVQYEIEQNARTSKTSHYWCCHLRTTLASALNSVTGGDILWHGLLVLVLLVMFSDKSDTLIIITHPVSGVVLKTIHRFHNRLYNHGEGPY